MKSVFTPLPLSRSPTHYVKESGEEEKQKGGPRGERERGKLLVAARRRPFSPVFLPTCCYLGQRFFFSPPHFHFPLTKERTIEGVSEWLVVEAAHSIPTPPTRGASLLLPSPGRVLLLLLLHPLLYPPPPPPLLPATYFISAIGSLLPGPPFPFMGLLPS